MADVTTWTPEEITHLGKDEPRDAFAAYRTDGVLPQPRPVITGDGPISWTRLSDVEMRSIRFHEKPLLQADAFHLVAGRKGMGKGTLLANIAARVTRGELGDKRNVLWIGSEDSAAIDIHPRVKAAGGDPKRVWVIANGWVQLPRDIPAIQRQIEEVGEVGMVNIDPVSNHIAGKNSNAEVEVREAISPLNALADQYALMAFGVRHLSEKECRAGALAAILGSSAWVQTPRAVLIVARDTEDPHVSHIQCVAGNRLPPDTPGRVFRIDGVRLSGLENEVTKATWIGDSTKSVENMLAARSGSREPSRSEQARTEILAILDDARRMESDALDQRIADEFGLSRGTVKNQRLRLREEGLIRMEPAKAPDGTVERWDVVRTEKRREDT